MRGLNKWTLFLDRDGVINRRLPDAYVENWDEFEFLPGVLDVLGSLTSLFNKTIIITNQRGISLGRMSSNQLEIIHQKMLDEIKRCGGNIDAIFYCSADYNDRENCRKPNPRMALDAKKQFPEIAFSQSFMVGDQYSDIKFGNNLNMKTVWIPENKNMNWDFVECNPNYICNSLVDFHELLKEMMNG